MALDPAIAAKILASFPKQGVMTSWGARLISIDEGRSEIELPFSDSVGQQQGFFHGGAIGAIADSSAGYAGLTLMPADKEVVTVEYKINFLRPALGELAIARGEVVRAGQALTVTRSEVVCVADGAEKVCAVMQQTLMPVDA